jgi:hypothetical protein
MDKWMGLASFHCKLIAKKILKSYLTLRLPRVFLHPVYQIDLRYGSFLKVIPKNPGENRAAIYFFTGCRQ